MSSSVSPSSSNAGKTTSDRVVDRPAFNQIYEAETVVDRPPTSMLAIMSFVVGLLSLIAPTSFKLVPLAVMAVALTGLIYWQLSRSSSYAGLRWALLGLGLSIVSLVWSLTANSLGNRYLFEQAGQNAKVYLELIGRGRIFDALELHVTKSGRQIAGTDLEAYYLGKTGEESERILQIMNSPETQEVERLGGKANWSLLAGVDVKPGSDSREQSVTIQMTNDVEPDRIATLTLTRQPFADTEGRRIAWWRVDTLTFDDLSKPPSTAIR